MYDAVLVPTDGSDGTDEALAHGVALAAEHGAVLHALYVVDRRRYIGADEGQDEIVAALEGEGEAAVEAAAERARAEGVEAATAIRDGVPEGEILDYVAENGIDLVVMATHGRIGRERLAHLGSVTDRVLRKAEVPVLVVSVGTE